MYKTHRNENIGNLRVQNAIAKETLTAPMYEENPNQLYLQVHFLNNPIRSSISEQLGNHTNVVCPLDDNPPNFNA